MSWAESDVTLPSTSTAIPANIDERIPVDIRVSLTPAKTLPRRRFGRRGSLQLRQRDIRYGGRVGSTVSLKQPLVGGRQEGESVEVILVVHFGAFGESGGRITRDDQADQYAVHIDLIAVGRCPATHAPAVGEHRIDRCIDRNHVSG